MFEAPPSQTTQEVSHNNESPETGPLSLTNLHEKTKRFGILAPVAFSLAACASIENRGDAIEVNTYDEIPEEFAAQLATKLGFTKEIAESCYLQFDPEAINNNDAPPVLMLGQIHAPTTVWSTIEEYEQAELPEEIKQFLDTSLNLLPYNQEAIRDLIRDMAGNKGGPVTMMPEGRRPETKKDLEFMRNFLDDVRSEIEHLEDIYKVYDYWRYVQQLPYYSNEPISDMYLSQATFTSQVMELFQENLENLTINSEDTEIEEQLRRELQAASLAKMTKTEWAWYIDGGTDAFARGWAEMISVDESNEYLERSRELTRENNHSQETLEMYNKGQQIRDAQIIERTQEAGGGVLIMGLKHSYTQQGAVTCVPRLGNGMNYQDNRLSNFIASLGK